MKLETNQAIVNGKNLRISTKISVSACKFIKNRNLKQAQVMLNEILNKKRALPLFRYIKDVSHKKGNVAAGRYPVNVSKTFLSLLNSVQKNAENKGLNADSLIITFAKANRGEERVRFGRKGRIVMKNTHVSIVVTETADNKKIMADKNKAEDKK